MGKYFREIQVPRFQRFPDSRGPDSRGFTVYIMPNSNLGIWTRDGLADMNEKLLEYTFQQMGHVLN